MTDVEANISQPKTAFALLGHDLRLEILLALLDRWEAAHTEPQRYSELMRAVEIQDSGKFNYHLGKLCGAYVQKVDGGYVPTASATALYRAVLAHRPTVPPNRTELTPGVACPSCTEDLIATYEQEFFTLSCPGCEDVSGEFTYPLPKNALDGRTDREVLRVVHDRARAHVGLARRGQCPDCTGITTVTVRRDALESGSDPPVVITCDTCTWRVESGVLLPLLTDAYVTKALADIGVALEDCYLWTLPDPEVTVAATDPVQFDISFEGDGGVAVVTVDDGLTVLATNTGDIDRTGNA